MLGGFAAIFMLMWLLIVLVAVSGFVVGIAALISMASTPTEAFGPWWDNTKQSWLIGQVIGFVIPLGALIIGVLWFSQGRPRPGRGAGRPFWSGPPKPAPPGYGSGSYGGFPGAAP